MVAQTSKTCKRSSDRSASACTQAGPILRMNRPAAGQAVRTFPATRRLGGCAQKQGRCGGARYCRPQARANRHLVVHEARPGTARSRPACSAPCGPAGWNCRTRSARSVSTRESDGRTRKRPASRNQRALAKACPFAVDLDGVDRDGDIPPSTSTTTRPLPACTLAGLSGDEGRAPRRTASSGTR